MTAGRAMRPEWIYSQRIFFESKAEGEVKIFGFYNNKTKKQKKPVGRCLILLYLLNFSHACARFLGLKRSMGIRHPLSPVMGLGLQNQSKKKVR